MNQRRYPLYWALLLIITLTFSSCMPVTVSPNASSPTSNSTVENSPENTATVVLPTATPTPLSTIEVKEEELKGVKIVLVHPLDGQAIQEMKQMADEFNQDNPWGIELEIHAAGSNVTLVDEINSGLKTSTTPQIVMGTTEQLADWQKNWKILINVDQYIQDPVWGLSAEQVAAFYPVIWNQDIVNEQRIGFPAIRTMEGIGYNRTWAHELGYEDPPLTLDEFYEQACKAAEKNNTGSVPGTGGWFMDTDAHVALNWLAAFNSAQIFDVTTGNYAFNTTENNQAFTYLRNLSEKKCAWNNEIPMPEESTEPYPYFASHQTLLTSLSVDEIPIQAVALKTAENTDDWVFLPYPTEDGNGVVLTYGYSYGMMASKPSEQLASWLVIRWFSEPEQMVRLAEATDTLPLTTATHELMSTTQQMEQAIALLGIAVTPPSDASWGKVQLALKDAVWEDMVQYQLIYGVANSPVRTTEEILKDLDDIAAEIVTNQ
jgi:ABC-type glycerol-3-phosphate transport system substrate-binding protein